MGVEKKLAAVDVFEQNSLLIFPHNEGIWHWVIFCVDPVSLKQSFYDSLNQRMSTYEYCEHVSMCIHRWVIDYHKLRKSTDHPKRDLRWSPELVEDDHEVLGNGMQIGCDCGLHILVLPVLIQKQLMLDVFGQTSKEKEAASIEIRQRIMLSIFYNKWYFIPDEARLNKIKVEAQKKRLEELERTLKEQGKRKRKAQYNGPPEAKKGK